MAAEAARKVPTFGYEPAPTPDPVRTPYVACVSWPRSGHHLLVNLLRLSLGGRFGYCEYYVPSTRPDVPCCKSFPCRKRDIMTMTKNHDFDLASPVPREQKFIVQYRAFPPTLVSNYELHVRNGNVDSEDSFRAFATRTLKSFKAFREKWIVPEMPNRFAIDYETLTTDPLGSLRAVLGFMGITDIEEDAMRRAVAEAPAREGGQGERGVRVTRDVAAFRWYDETFFDLLAAVAADDAAPPLPLIDPPDGPRRNTSASRPLYVYIHLPRSAGVSVRVAFTELLGRHAVFWHGRDGDVPEILGRDGADKFAPFDVVGGTFSPDLFPAKIGKRPVVLCAVVRNPIGRVISLYTQRHAAGELPGTLVEALADGSPFAAEVRAAQSLTLAGTADGGAALRKILARPHVLATHEHAGELVGRIGAIIGMASSVALKPQNHNPPGYQAALRTPDALARVRRLVQSDMALFQHINGAGGLVERLPTTEA